MNDEFRVVRNPRGYYTLYRNGVFCGNYDSVYEAGQEIEQIKKEEEAVA